MDCLACAWKKTEMSSLFHLMRNKLTMWSVDKLVVLSFCVQTESNAAALYSEVHKVENLA